MSQASYYRPKEAPVRVILAKLPLNTFKERNEYLIWAREPTNAAKVGETDSAIHQIPGPNAEIAKRTMDDDVVSFWFTALSSSQAEQIGKLDGVSFSLSRDAHADLC